MDEVRERGERYNIRRGMQVEAWQDDGLAQALAGRNESVPEQSRPRIGTKSFARSAGRLWSAETHPTLYPVPPLQHWAETSPAMPEKTLQEDEPSRQSNLTLLSSGLRDRVESLITSLDTVTVDVVSEYQNIKTDVHNEQPDLNLDSLLPREKLAILAKFNRPYENARPHHQYLAGTAWQLDQSSFVTRFGEAAYLNLRILKLLRALSKEDSDFDHIHAQLQEQRGHRLTGALKTRGVRKHIDWQPWEFEQVLQRYRERTDSRTQARSCNPAASKAPVLRSGHDANRDELPPLQDHSSHEVQPVDSPQAQPRSVPRLSSAVQVRRSNDVCTTQVVRGTKRKRFHESGPEESTGRAPKHKVGPEEAEEEALQTPDSPSEDLTSPSIELGRRERVDFKPPESPFLPSDDQLSDLSLPEPASSPFVLIDDCDHSDHVQTSVHDIRPEVGGIEPMLSTMQGQTRLNDECIYTALLAFRPQQPGWVIAHSTTLCVSDLASQAIRNNSRIISTKTYAYDLLIPIFWPISQHWTLGHFDLGRKIATHFDSLTSSQRCIKASSVLSAFLSSLCQDVTGWQFYNSVSFSSNPLLFRTNIYQSVMPAADERLRLRYICSSICHVSNA